MSGNNKYKKEKNEKNISHYRKCRCKNSAHQSRIIYFRENILGIKIFESSLRTIPITVRPITMIKNLTLLPESTSSFIFISALKVFAELKLFFQTMPISFFHYQ